MPSTTFSAYVATCAHAACAVTLMVGVIVRVRDVRMCRADVGFILDVRLIENQFLTRPTWWLGVRTTATSSGEERVACVSDIEALPKHVP